MSTNVNLVNPSATVTTTPLTLLCLGKKVNGKISCISLANSNDVLNVSLYKTNGKVYPLQLNQQQSYVIKNMKLDQISLYTNISTATVSYSFTLNDEDKGDGESIELDDSYPLRTNITNTVPVIVNNSVPVYTNSMNVTFLSPGSVITANTTTSTSSIGGMDRGVFVANVTAVSGTSPTLNITVVGQDPASGVWVPIQSFSQITATGTYTLPISQLGFSVIAVSLTVGGTSPSFTLSIGAVFKG